MNRRTAIFAVSLAACRMAGNDLATDAMPDGPLETWTNKLTVKLEGVGAGHVEATTISCGSHCTALYPDTTEVTLVARAEAGSRFAGWGPGECELPLPKSDTCVVKVQGDTQVHATFKAPQLRTGGDVTDGSGIVTTNLGDCNDGCEVLPGTQVTVTATADVSTHSVLSRWTSPACTEAGPCTFTMPTSDTSAIAVFGRDNSVDNGTTAFTATVEGAPAWTVDGFEIAAVYGALQPQADRMWKGHAYSASANAFYPQKEHAGPYATEPARRCTEYGWDTGNRFPVIDWSTAGGRSLAFFGVIVPSANAPTGSTRDYASGPVIPRSLELYVDADLYKDEVLVDADFDGAYPSLAALDPTSTEAGSSHLPLTFAENQHYIPGTPGVYRLHVHVYESATPANGWQINLPFTIDP